MSPTNDDPTAPRLDRLSALDDYEVAEGHPDIRGWTVKTPDGRTIGKVDELIADTGAMRVRYVDVELDRTIGELAHDAATPGDQERHTLLPIGIVRLDDAHDDVLVDGYTVDQIVALPRYGGDAIAPDYERAIQSRFGGAATAGAVAAGAAGASPYDHADYDDQRAFAGRRARRGMTLVDTGDGDVAVPVTREDARREELIVRRPRPIREIIAEEARETGTDVAGDTRNDPDVRG